MKISLSYLFLVCALHIFKLNAEFDSMNYTEKQLDELKNQIQSQLQKNLTEYLQSQGAPGGCISLNLKCGQPIDVCAGLSDVPQNIPMQANMHYRIASTTKTFTAASILKLEEQNKLSLNDTVNKYFPDLAIPNKDKMTIYHLLHMSSGLYDYLNDYYSIEAFQNAYTPQQLIEASITHDIEYLPGEGYSYSNTNYVMLGVIIEQVSGKNYADFIKDLVNPLGLTETYEPINYSLSEPYVKGYVKTIDGDQEVYEFNPSAAFATGSMISTVQEMTKWTKALMEGKVLGDNAMKQLLDFSVETELGYYGGGLEKYEATKLGMDALPAENLVGKLANIIGYSSIMTYAMDDSISMVVFINYENQMNPFLSANIAMISLEIVQSIIAEFQFGLQTNNDTQTSINGKNIMQFLVFIAVIFMFLAFHKF